MKIVRTLLLLAMTAGLAVLFGSPAQASGDGCPENPSNTWLETSDGPCVGRADWHCWYDADTEKYADKQCDAGVTHH